MFSNILKIWNFVRLCNYFWETVLERGENIPSRKNIRETVQDIWEMAYITLWWWKILKKNVHIFAVISYFLI